MPALYETYEAVPVYRRQWFFWVAWFFVAPIAVGLLLTGDVYYARNGEVQRFGIANKIVAGLIALVWSWALINALIHPS